MYMYDCITQWFDIVVYCLCFKLVLIMHMDIVTLNAFGYYAYVDIVF